MGSTTLKEKLAADPSPPNPRRAQFIANTPAVIEPPETHRDAIQLTEKTGIIQSPQRSVRGERYDTTPAAQRLEGFARRHISCTPRSSGWRSPPVHPRVRSMLFSTAPMRLSSVFDTMLARHPLPAAGGLPTVFVPFTCQTDLAGRSRPLRPVASGRLPAMGLPRTSFSAASAMWRASSVRFISQTVARVACPTVLGASGRRCAPKRMRTDAHRSRARGDLDTADLCDARQLSQQLV